MGRIMAGFWRTLAIQIILSLFLMFFFKRCLAISTSLNSTVNVSKLRLARIQRYLATINKPPVFTIQSSDGDFIDCVNKTIQPAFDHPLLKNHKIQSIPSEMPKAMKMGTTNLSSGINIDDSEVGWQLWHQKGQMCPEGTIPIRRSTVNDVLRAKSLTRFGKKQVARSSVGLNSVASHNHEYATVSKISSEGMYGTKALINVWDPMVEDPEEFSLSQIWVLAGSDGIDLNSIEVGWQVFPYLYGDNRPRLFIYWTRDAYRSTGCYNLLCSGFVQVNRQIVVGATISPISSIGKQLYEISITVWKDPKTGNWWVAYGGNKALGYWPKEIFTNLADHATRIDWGGEIVNHHLGGKHTSTQMGSGHFAGDGHGKASYFRNLEIVNSQNQLNMAQDVITSADHPNCYNIQSSYNNKMGLHFYYGGPGRSPQCP